MNKVGVVSFNMAASGLGTRGSTRSLHAQKAYAFQEACRGAMFGGVLAARQRAGGLTAAKPGPAPR